MAARVVRVMYDDISARLTIAWLAVLPSAITPELRVF
jgi:hypothetical protein